MRSFVHLQIIPSIFTVQPNNCTAGMPLQQRLLPASARPLVRRQPPAIDLGPALDAWIVEILERANKCRRKMETISQCNELLQDVLGSPHAHWLLASVLFPVERPESKEQEWTRQPEDLHLIHITGLVLYVDMSTHHEIAFKISSCTQTQLIRLHEIKCLSYNGRVPSDCKGREEHYSSLNKAFARTVDSAVFHASVSELNNMEDDGSGELLEGRPGVVREAIDEMMLRFLPAARHNTLGPSSILSVYVDSAQPGRMETAENPRLFEGTSNSMPIDGVSP